MGKQHVGYARLRAGVDTILEDRRKRREERDKEKVRQTVTAVLRILVFRCFFYPGIRCFFEPLDLVSGAFLTSGCGIRCFSTPGSGIRYGTVLIPAGFRIRIRMDPH
jgi:hypothetical protein